MSQTMNALIGLRERILNGELRPGQRLLEIDLVDQLNVSRTPIRSALVRLAEEGLIERLPNGGFRVREFSVRDIEDAIEVRGTLEGMAARLAAERGVSPLILSKMKTCVADFDELLGENNLTSDDISRYFELNALFHNHLIALSESFIIGNMIERIVTLPLASPNAFVMAQSEIGQAWKILFTAQQHHRGIVEAIENREGSRAESLAREHARLSLRALKTALNTGAGLHQIPGFRLIHS